MKTLLLLLTTFTATHLFAQTTTIYGKVTKSDGSRIKGTSTMKGYEDQLIISNYTGGADNTATIEIEVPTGVYMATFRDMINAPTPKTQVAKAIATRSVNNNNVITAALPQKTITQPSLPSAPIARIDISVTNRVSNNMPTLSNQIILEDVKVESCSDMNGTSKIKLKAARIGWLYFSKDPKTGKANGTTKSGWDTIAGIPWTNF